MAAHWFCDGLRRRDFIKAGAAGASTLTLSRYLRLASAGEVKPAKATGAIFINLGGGPPHTDTFDLKPNGPSEFRGEFSPIATNVPGIEICEHLPKLAKCADKFAILRGVSHSIAAHEQGLQYMNTGSRPIPSITHPGFGAVISKEFPGAPDLPSFVAIPSTPQSGGYLGVRYAALETTVAPRLGQPFIMRGISLADTVTVSEVEKRQKLLHDLDAAFTHFEGRSELVEGLDEFSEQAYNIISSPKAREAFNTAREPRQLADRFGNHPFGQSCLLAVRLIEAGVRFATVNFPGWDTHTQNFTSLKSRLLPQLDDGLSSLFETLAERGLLESTAVVVTGEFGRTPKINIRAGREHWPRAMFVLMAGGGMKGGQVIGASDEAGMGPAGDGISPEAVAASFYHSLGIDFTKEYHTPNGRPIMIVRDGQVIPQLFG